MCILSALCIAKSYWLLWFECYVHVSDGFPKKSLDGVGGMSSIQIFLGICLTLQSPLVCSFSDSAGQFGTRPLRCVLVDDILLIIHPSYTRPLLCA